MRIDPDKCVACGNCTYVCPMGAIYIDPVIKRATVDREECVECYACYNGLSQEHLNPTIVRTMRKVFQMLRSGVKRISLPVAELAGCEWPDRRSRGPFSPGTGRGARRCSRAGATGGDADIPG